MRARAAHYGRGPAGGKQMVGRNDPCWCGSGAKYKKCHYSSDQAQGGPPAAATATTGGKPVKTPEEMEGMRRAGAFNGELMDFIRPYVKPGINTEEINKLVHQYTLDHGHKPATLGYHGFPKSLCTSINNVVCHGIPSPGDVLKEGDIVNLDLTTIVDGYYGDSSETYFVGEVSAEARKVTEVAARGLLLGIEAVRPGHTLRHIAEAIQPYVESQGCSVVRDYTGHGIGRVFHEKGFSVMHHVTREAGRFVLRPGMTFTIEPMVNLGDWRVTTDKDDGWTVRTRDGSLSAQFEHTVMVTQDGVEVLTMTPSQRAAGQRLIVAGLELA